MSEEPAEPRSGKGELLTQLEREDLDFYSLTDLSERIARLKAEMTRTEQKLSVKKVGLSAADALFKF
jgi:uncharacterized small protein (DUF1192 family)